MLNNNRFKRRKNEKQELEETVDNQFSLDLDDPFVNRYYKIKEKVFLKLRYYETKGFARNPFLWFFGILTLALIAGQIYWIREFITELPPELPLYANYRDLSQKLADKNDLYIFPIMSILILTSNIFISLQLYNRFKNLINLSLTFSFIATSMITYTLIRLLSEYVV
jgi:hypothetical protein